MNSVALLNVYLFDLYGYCRSIRSSSYTGACFCDVSGRCHHVASYRNVGRRLESARASDELIFVALGMFHGLPTKNGTMSEANCRRSIVIMALCIRSSIRLAHIRFTTSFPKFLIIIWVTDFTAVLDPSFFIVNNFRRSYRVLSQSLPGSCPFQSRAHPDIIYAHE